MIFADVTVLACKVSGCEITYTWPFPDDLCQVLPWISLGQQVINMYFEI